MSKFQFDNERRIRPIDPIYQLTKELPGLPDRYLNKKKKLKHRDKCKGRKDKIDFYS